MVIGWLEQQRCLIARELAPGSWLRNELGALAFRG